MIYDMITRTTQNENLNEGSSGTPGTVEEIDYGHESELQKALRRSLERLEQDETLYPKGRSSLFPQIERRFDLHHDGLSLSKFLRLIDRFGTYELIFKEFFQTKFMIRRPSYAERYSLVLKPELPSRSGKYEVIRTAYSVKAQKRIAEKKDRFTEMIKEYFKCFAAADQDDNIREVSRSILNKEFFLRVITKDAEFPANRTSMKTKREALRKMNICRIQEQILREQIRKNIDIKIAESNEGFGRNIFLCETVGNEFLEAMILSNKKSIHTNKMLDMKQRLHDPEQLKRLDKICVDLEQEYNDQIRDQIKFTLESGLVCMNNYVNC